MIPVGLSLFAAGVAAYMISCDMAVGANATNVMNLALIAMLAGVISSVVGGIFFCISHRGGKQKRRKNEDAPVCKHCGNKAAKDSRFCRHCGRAIEHPRTSAECCAKCGEILPYKATHCAKCGAKVNSIILFLRQQNSNKHSLLNRIKRHWLLLVLPAVLGIIEIIVCSAAGYDILGMRSEAFRGFAGAGGVISLITFLSSVSVIAYSAWRVGAVFALVNTAVPVLVNVIWSLVYIDTGLSYGFAEYLVYILRYPVGMLLAVGGMMFVRRTVALINYDFLKALAIAGVSAIGGLGVQWLYNAVGYYRYGRFFEKGEIFAFFAQTLLAIIVLLAAAFAVYYGYGKFKPKKKPNKTK